MLKGTRIISGKEAALMTSTIDAMRRSVHRRWL
jgi:hypothetical protein